MYPAYARWHGIATKGTNDGGIMAAMPVRTAMAWQHQRVFADGEQAISQRLPYLIGFLIMAAQVDLVKIHSVAGGYPAHSGTSL